MVAADPWAYVNGYLMFSSRLVDPYHPICISEVKMFSIFHEQNPRKSQDVVDTEARH